MVFEIEASQTKNFSNLVKRLKTKSELNRIFKIIYPTINTQN
jgi:hypothetical protein